MNSIKRSVTPGHAFRSLVVAAALAASAVAAPVVRAEAPGAVSTLDALATVMKDVGKAVEPSVVSIDVEKRGTALASNGGFDDDLLKKFFPDTDGDGKPDVPQNFKFRFRGPNGNQGGNDDGDGSGDGTQGRTFGEGSGVILDATADKAYILTNNHVAGDAVKLTVTLYDGRKIDDVKVLGTDPRSDLAVLEIKAEGLKATRWGNSDPLEKGDIVLAFGAPFGYVGSMTQGIVSAKNRQANLLGRDGYEYFIQTDCAINPGNSGGPLVNTHGEIVGINTAIASSSGGFNGIGFAIPSNLAKFVYDQLKETGKVTRGYLGVEIRDTTTLPKNKTALLKLNGKQGVWVGQALDEAPAAGKLLPNDVIVSIDGQPIATSQDLRLKVATTKPGSELKLGVLRGGKEETVTLAVGTLPEREQTASNTGPDKPEAATAELGATLSDASAARLKSAGLHAGAKGALVTEIKAGSPAQLAGLEIGNLILRVNDVEVGTADEAAKALKSGKLADGIDLLVQTRTGTRSIFIQSE